MTSYRGSLQEDEIFSMLLTPYQLLVSSYSSVNPPISSSISHNFVIETIRNMKQLPTGLILQIRLIFPFIREDLISQRNNLKATMDLRIFWLNHMY